MTEDHPRIRGTNLPYGLVPVGVSGSSPHTRDKFYCLFQCLPLLGIIPAYAGQIRVRMG